MIAMRCANHPDVETHLRCSRCEKPICPRCMVQTPVGARCRECANVKKAPIFQVGAGRYAIAASYGLGAALVGGFLWAVLGASFGRAGSLLGLSSLLLLLLGYVVGEAVSRGAGGRVSRGLVVMAGAFTVLGAVAGRAMLLFAALPGSAPLALRLQASVGLGIESLLGNLFGLLFLVLAVVVATSRVR